MFWILVILLVVVGGGGALALVAGARSRQLSAGTRRPKALPSNSDMLIERSVRDLRVGDVLTMDGHDFLCEGLISYDEDGHRWTCARAVDGADIRWMLSGIERTGGGTLRMLTVDKSLDVSGYPAELLVVGDIRYVLDKRGNATCKFTGDLAGMATPGRPAQHVERCRWWLYNAPGDDTLLVEQWGTDYRVLRGKIIAETTVDLIVGS